MTSAAVSWGPVAGGHPCERGVRPARAVAERRPGRRGRGAGRARVFRAQGVVPVAVPGVPVQRQGGHLLVADLDPGVIGAGVEVGADGQPGPGGGRGDRVDDDLVAGQRPAPPIHRDVGEQPVLDPVPLRCPRREVAHRDRKPIQGLGSDVTTIKPRNHIQP
jgi:hypothetical protein